MTLRDILDEPLVPKPVSFYHPRVNGGKTLSIDTGPNSIKWGYTLNEVTIPTYGGEVKQILSASIDNMTISGTSENNRQLERIYTFFRDYMTNAGGFGQNNPQMLRDEQPVIFKYPHRGWQFAIQPMEAPDYKFGVKLLGTEWQVVAHVVDRDDSRVKPISMQIMNQFTKVFNNVPVGIGYNSRNKWSDPVWSEIEPNSGEQSLDQIAYNLGDNFQRLIGAWSFGDFTHFAFDSTAPASYNQLTTSSQEYWTQLFGSDYVQTVKAGSQATGAGGVLAGGSPSQVVGGTWPGDDQGREPIALWMASHALAAGLPPELPVMASLVETGGQLKNLNYGDADSLGYFQMRTSVWLNKYPNYPGDPGKQMQWFIDQAVKLIPPTKADGFRSPWDAGKLGAFAQAIEGSAFPDKYQATYAEARQLIGNLDRYLNRQGGDSVTGSVGPQGAYAYPLGVRGTVGQRPYEGTHLLDHNWESDNAIDISTAFGTPVYAVTDGTIGSQIGLLGGSGITNSTDPNDIIFKGRLAGNRLHLIANGNEWYYAHLCSISVMAGQRVTKGQLLGHSGRAADADHLHFAQQTGDPGLTVGSASPGYVDRHYPA